jgi:hypothetical protein
MLLPSCFRSLAVLVVISGLWGGVMAQTNPTPVPVLPPPTTAPAFPLPPPLVDDALPTFDLPPLPREFTPSGPATGIPPRVITPADPHASCQRAQELFERQALLQQALPRMLNQTLQNLREAIRDLDPEKLMAAEAPVRQMEQISAQLNAALEECRQNTREPQVFSPCDEVPLLEASLRAAIEARLHELRGQALQSQLPRLPSIGGMMDGLPPGLAESLSPARQIPELQRQLQQAQMECQRLHSQLGIP